MERMSDKPMFPRTARQLRAWLRDTTIGRQLFRELAKDVLEEECRKCQRIRPYPKVLVVVRRLGTLPCVEVFREKGVTVRLEELVDTHEDAIIEILGTELTEKLLVAQLPKPWRHLPYCKSESRCFHGITAERRLKVLGDLEELRIYREFGESLKP